MITDQEINKLLKVQKTIELREYNKLYKFTRTKGQHKEQEVALKGEDGNDFIIKTRLSKLNPLDFSAILGYILPNKTTIFRLRRYNGKSHEHKNKLEKQKFYDFHIHTATERYQALGYDEEGYAQATNGYSDLHSAIDMMIKECNIGIPSGAQTKLI